MAISSISHIKLRSDIQHFPQYQQTPNTSTEDETSAQKIQVP